MFHKRAFSALLLYSLFLLSSCGPATSLPSSSQSPEPSSSSQESTSGGLMTDDMYDSIYGKYFGTVELGATRDLSMTAYAVNEKNSARLMIGKGGAETTAYTAEGGSLIYGVQWSPDEKRVAFFVRNMGVHHLYLYNVTSGRLTDTALEGPGSVWNVWSSDSTKVLFSDYDSGIFYWDTVAQKVVTVVSVNKIRESAISVGFSPDGKRIAYWLQTKGTPEMMIVKTYDCAGGTTTEHLRFENAVRCNGSMATPAWPSYPAWISDTALVIGMGCLSTIYQFDLASNQKTILVEKAHRPVVSPDRKYLIYEDVNQNNKPLLKNIVTGAVTEFTGIAEYVAPFWSADSKQIYLCTDTSIRTYGLDGKQMGDTIETPTFGISPPVMTKDGLWYQGKK